jgi:hypothetical protein
MVIENVCQRNSLVELFLDGVLAEYFVKCEVEVGKGQVIVAGVVHVAQLEEKVGVVRKDGRVDWRFGAGLGAAPGGKT